MKRALFFVFIIFLMLDLHCEGIRIANERNIFSDDEGEREELYFKLFNTAGPQFGWISISPDGKKIAFDYTCLRDACPFTIAVASIDGTTDVKIISNKEDAMPVWSPDGKKIAFSSHRTGDWNIFIMDSDGSNQRQLTYGGGVDPAWSPDGTKIAFVTNNSEGGASVFTIKTDGTGLFQITAGKISVSSPCWSPDGTKIAFVSNINGEFNIWVINSDGSGLRQITNYPNGAGCPCWTPDGNWIIFNTTVDTYPSSPLKKDRICAINLNTNQIVVLKELLIDELNFKILSGLGPVSISADGKKVAFWLAEPDSTGIKEGIYVADLEIY